MKTWRERESEMEMEMRAKEDIEIGEDITSPLPPLSLALHDPFLLSHCSSCFSPLHNTPTFSSIAPIVPSILFCSPHCSNSLSTILYSLLSSTFHHHLSHTSDLRASLRLLHLFQFHPSAWHPGPPERIFGLLTNREKLMCYSSRDNLDDNDDGAELLTRIREGAKIMARIRTAAYVDTRNDTLLEEAVLCLVLTNAVEVQDSGGRTLGIAVYDTGFCWINHSCSPNACYGFSLSPSIEMASVSSEARTRIAAGCRSTSGGEGSCQVESGVCSNLCDLIAKDDKKCQTYGPRIVVRSVKRIKKGDEVTITYTDLLQPKVTRQSELWSRYRFVCCCQRCSTLTYVDNALQGISCANLELSTSTSAINFYCDKAIRRLTNYTYDAIDEYLSIGNPKSCCEKLENMLVLGFSDESLEGDQGKQLTTFMLHPLHHLSLNTYTTLASAYRVRSSDILALYPEVDEHLFEAFEMNRISAAYTLLLAGATNYLFLSEPSLIACAANFWTGAGESLLTLAKSSIWIKFVERLLPVSQPSFVGKDICSRCSLVNKYSADSFHIQVLYAEFQDVSDEFCNCLTNISQNTWSFLTLGCPYLRIFKDPFDFSWDETETNCRPRDVESYSTDDLGSSGGSKYSVSWLEARGYFGERRIFIFQLALHCLLYGGYLASICYGHRSHLACKLGDILDKMNS